MSKRRERLDIVTPFPGNIELEKQWDVTLETITSPKRIQYDKQLDSSIVYDNTNADVYNMLPPRLPLKLKAPETLFIPQEIRSLEEPLLLPLRRGSP
jgi:hypothetical protein